MDERDTHSAYFSRSESLNPNPNSIRSLLHQRSPLLTFCALVRRACSRPLCFHCRLWFLVRQAYYGEGGTEAAQNQIAVAAASEPSVQQAAISGAANAHQQRADGSAKFPGER